MTTTANGAPVVVRDLEQLRRLPSWCLRWSEHVGAWLYYPPASDRASA